jgi:4-aminobutyrate aminotransferase-like enzyme
VVQEENLQMHARRVGERLLEGLRELQRQHDLIRDVRGSGLFIGVELMRGDLPATEVANRIANQMRVRGILLGTDGPHHNVIKIRPPMPFSEADADQLLETLDSLL